MRIAFLVNLTQNAPPIPVGMPSDYFYELDDESNLRVWQSALENAGHEVVFFEGNAALFGHLIEYRPDICFNTCEGHFGDSRESQIPALLEMLNIPYTGATPLGLSITLHKPTTKRLLAYSGLPTPPFQVFYSANDPISSDLTFPLFCKPEHEGCGIGVGLQSIVHCDIELRDRVRHLVHAYKQPVLVENFVPGREVTVGIVGNLRHPSFTILTDPLTKNLGIHIFPILEIDFEGYPPEIGKVFSAKAKIDLPDMFRYRCPAPISNEEAEQLRILAAEAFRVTHCRDVARVDLKIGTATDFSPTILEVNALPGLGIHSDLTTMAKVDGWDHETLLLRILNSAIERHKA